MISKFTHLCGFIVCVLQFLPSIGLLADEIDFENGYSDGQIISTINSATNSVNVSVVGGGAPTIAEVGGPITAFVPNDDPVGGFPGSFFLSDGSVSQPNEYFLSFDNPISNLSIDLYDYALQAGSGTFTVFGSQGFTEIVGQQEFSPSNTDGGIIFLSISDPSAPILSASITFSVGDPGNGIDNIAFNTIPEPGTSGVVAILSTLLLSRRTRKNSRSTKVNS